MIPRLGDGNSDILSNRVRISKFSLEIDSPSSGRKLLDVKKMNDIIPYGLEIDSPSRGRKRVLQNTFSVMGVHTRLEIDSPSRGRKPREELLELTGGRV